MLDIEDAAHEEIDPGASRLVITRLACSLVGARETVRVALGSVTHRAYGTAEAEEQFRCDYGLNPLYRDAFTYAPLRVSGTDAEGQVRIVELPSHRFYLATLFLPQLSSTPDAPHPLVVAFLTAACERRAQRGRGHP